MQETIITIYRVVTAYTVMSITGSAALLLRVLSFGLLTEFCRTYLISASSRMILRLAGVKLILPPRSAFTQGPVLYTFNHNSFLDVFIVTALGLPKTRILLSESTLKFIPVTFSALAIGTLYIPQKKAAERRMRFFRNTTEKVKKEACSVFASSEGVHTFVHGIAPFNKGIYHMAINTGLPVVPLYFHIPEEVNSLEGFRFKSGTVRIEMLERIDTSAWQPERLEEHSESVREIFIKKFNESHGIQG